MDLSKYTPKELLRLVERRHPSYNKLYEHWNFMQSTYDGGREWFDEHIFQYLKEGDKEFKDRVERAYRFNHTREVVDLINKYLFKQAITRNTDDAPASLAEFWLKATKSGLSIKDLSRQISKKTSMFGRIAVVVDTTTPKITPKNGASLSVAEMKEAGIKCYAYLVEPQHLLDYSYDEDGELNWVLIHEVQRDDLDPVKSSGEPINCYRLWTKDSWVLLKKTKEKNKVAVVEIVEQGYHGLGEVPIVIADNIISDEEYTSQALIDDIAYLDRAIANYLSNLDAIIQDQTFSQLAMPAQNALPGEESSTKATEMGTQRIFLYDGEGGGRPEFISPDVKQAHLILDAISKIVNEIYHTVGLAGERTKQDNAVGIDNSSGVAKAYDFERVNALLTAKADSLERIENKIADIVLKWYGEKRDVEFISYPDNFDTRGLYDEFDIAARLMLIDAPDGIRRSQMEAIVDKLFPQIGKSKREELLKSLETWPVNVVDLSNRLTDKNGGGDLQQSTSTNPGEAQDKTEAEAKNPNGSIKATKNNRQGQVTNQTK